MIRPAHPRFSFPGDDEPRESARAADQDENRLGHPSLDDQKVDRIKKLPAGVGVILMTAGVAGLILPGPIGTPLFVAGGLILAPRLFGKLDDYLKKRLPELRHHGIHAVDRFVGDLEKRYPSSDDIADVDSTKRSNDR